MLGRTGDFVPPQVEDYPDAEVRRGHRRPILTPQLPSRRFYAGNQYRHHQRLPYFPV